MGVYDVAILIFAAAALWALFIEPGIEAREDASMRKKRDFLERKEKALKLEEKELELNKKEFDFVFGKPKE